LDTIGAKNIYKGDKYNTNEASIFLEETCNVNLKNIHKYFLDISSNENGSVINDISNNEEKKGVYMIILGKTEDLKDKFRNIPENIEEGSFLVKIGYSSDICKRAKQHFKFFMKILNFNSESYMSLEIYSLIKLTYFDAKDAENYITSKLIKNRKNKISVNISTKEELNEKFFNEIFVINNKDELFEITTFILNKEKLYKNNINKKYEDKLQKKDEEIEVYKDEIEVYKDEILTKNNELQIKNVELQTKIDEIQIKNEVIQTKNYEIQIKNEVIQTKNDEIQIKNDELQIKNDEILVYKNEIEEYKEELKKKDKEIRLLLELLNLKTQ